VASMLQTRTRRLLGVTLSTALLMGLTGCGSDGTGTIKVDPGARERALNPGGDAAKPANGKQAKAKASEEEAAKKNRKLL